MFKIKDTTVQNNSVVNDGYRKLVNSFLTGIGLLLLTFVFGASSDAFGQKREPREPKQREPQTKPEKDPKPAKEPRSIDFSLPKEKEPRVVEVSPKAITNESGEITGAGVEVKIKIN